jgi:hypothetical protein
VRLLCGTAGIALCVGFFHAKLSVLNSLNLKKMIDTMVLTLTPKEAIDKRVDRELIALILTSETVEQWNETREHMKHFRSMEWISAHVDASGLIGKTKIATKPCE